MASVCLPASNFDSSATCGNCTIEIRNTTRNKTVLVIPRVSRQPGGQCIQLSGFDTPFLAAPGYEQEFSIPTLIGGNTTVPPNADGTVSAYYPYNSQDRIAFVEISYVLVTSTSLTTSGLASHAGDMWAYLDGKADMDTLSTTQFVVNTCSPTTGDYSISSDNSETMMAAHGFSVVAISAPHPNRTSANVMSLLFSDIVDSSSSHDPDAIPMLSDYQRNTIQAPWQISTIVVLVVGVLVSSMLAVWGMHHWSLRPHSAEYYRNQHLNNARARGYRI